MSRLLVHRESFRADGGRGQLLRLEDLGPEEYEQINADFFARVRFGEAATLDEIYRAYAAALHDWGIMCPHPLAYRLYDGEAPARSPIPFDTCRWYDCTLCGAAVINR